MFNSNEQEIISNKSKYSMLKSMGKSMNSNNLEDYGYAHRNQVPSAFFYNTYSRNNTPQSRKHEHSESPSAYLSYNKNLNEKISNETMKTRNSRIDAASDNIRASSLGLDSNNQKILGLLIF